MGLVNLIANTQFHSNAAMIDDLRVAFRNLYRHAALEWNCV